MVVAQNASRLRSAAVTDKERHLIAHCIQGEKASWDEFVLEYSAPVYHTVRKTLALHHAAPNDDFIEDLHQEFFLSMLRDDFKKLRQFKGERGMESKAIPLTT